MLFFKQKCAFSAFVFLFIPFIAHAAIDIVAAENVYGNVVNKLGGNYVHVTNIINAPQQDPHLFTLTPSLAQQITQAKVIILNGANYDAWILPLLTPKVVNKSYIVNVAALYGIQIGENPHVWYMPEVMLRFAQTMTSLLSEIDPDHANYFQQQMQQFAKEYEKLVQKINQLRTQYQNTPVIATEPIFNYMAEAIGLDMHGIPFQVSNMNDVQPAISEIKQFEDDLRNHNVKVLIYDKQVVNPLTERMIAIAEEVHIPVIGVSEMMPEKVTYAQWMMNELNELEVALRQVSQH